MSSRGKKKTTMAKLSRESRLRQRRIDKEARKEARRHAATLDPADHLGSADAYQPEDYLDPADVPQPEDHVAPADEPVNPPAAG
ncbi:MAG: hypothetical protein ACJ780_00375 [Solirubrobacteraceae bacterium]